METRNRSGETGERSKILSDTIEISVRRTQKITVPTLRVQGKNIIVKGRWIKTAIIHNEEWLETGLEDPELCLEKLKQGPPCLRADLFTFVQKLPDVAARYSYPTEWESLAAVRVTSFNDWWNNLPQVTRKNVRRSQKRGVLVTVREFDDDLIKGIMEVNNDSPTVQGAPNPYCGRSFQEAKKDYSAFVGRSDFICAHFEGQLLGFLKLVYRGEIASILSFISRADESDKRPANALIAKAVELCQARGATYLTYGNYNYGNKRDSPLREFKIRNGFSEILTPRYYVPLTLWGALCLKLKVHRGLLGVLPHSVISAGVRLRRKWYSLTASNRRCSSTTERPNSNRQMGRSIPPAGSNP